MMLTLLICLANSKKYGERCIAGVEVEKDGKKLKMVHRSDGSPKWIRPVTNDVHGQVPAKLVQDVKVGDLLEIDPIYPVPDAFQTENVLFRPRSLQKRTNVKFRQKTLDTLAASNPVLFVNKSNRVPVAEMNNIQYSLTFIQASNFEPYMAKIHYKPTLRARFTYCDYGYDLPVTDVNYNINFRKHPEASESPRPAWLTISLGLKYEGFHYKLVAGIVEDTMIALKKQTEYQTRGT